MKAEKQKKLDRIKAIFKIIATYPNLSKEISSIIGQCVVIRELGENSVSLDWYPTNIEVKDILEYKKPLCLNTVFCSNFIEATYYLSNMTALVPKQEVCLDYDVFGVKRLQDIINRLTPIVLAIEQIILEREEAAARKKLIAARLETHIAENVARRP